MPVGKKTITANDFFQKKEWHVLSLMGSMLPEPYPGCRASSGSGRGSTASRPARPRTPGFST